MNLKTEIDPEHTLGVLLCGLLVKHRIIPASAIDDAEGYDNYQTMGNIRAVAKDLTVILTN